MNAVRKKIMALFSIYTNLAVPAKAAMWYVVCTFFQKGIATITTPIFTRILDVGEYGRASTFYSWEEFATVVITFALSSVVYTKGIIQREENADAYTSEMMTLSFVTAISSFGICSLLYLINGKVFAIDFRYICLIYLSAVFTTIIDFYNQKNRVMYKYIPVIVLTMTMVLMKPVLAITAITLFPGDKVLARVTAPILLMAMIGSVLGYRMLRRGKSYVNLPVWKESMLFVLPLIPHYLSQRVLSQSDRIMIQQMVGNDSAGIYSLAYSVGMLTNFLSVAISNAFNPMMFRNFKEKNYRKVGTFSEKLMIWFALCGIFFSMVSPELVGIFATKAYYEAIYIIPIISLSMYFIFVYSQLIQVEYYNGKTKYIMVATIFSAAVNLILNFIFIPRFGYIAAAYTTLFCYILYALGHYIIASIISREFFRIKSVFDGKKIIMISIVAFIGSIGAMLLYRYTIPRWGAAAVVLLLIIQYSLRILKGYER